MRSNAEQETMLSMSSTKCKAFPLGAIQYLLPVCYLNTHRHVNLPVTSVKLVRSTVRQNT